MIQNQYYARTYEAPTMYERMFSQLNIFLASTDSTGLNDFNYNEILDEDF